MEFEKWPAICAIAGGADGVSGVLACVACYYYYYCYYWNTTLKKKMLNIYFWSKNLKNVPIKKCLNLLKKGSEYTWIALEWCLKLAKYVNGSD